MVRLVIRIALATAIVSASGCRETELTKLEAIKTEVCACKTAECADAAMKKLPTVATGRPQPTTHRSQIAARAIVDCLAKLYAKPTETAASPGPSADPEAAPSPPAAP